MNASNLILPGRRVLQPMHMTRVRGTNSALDARRSLDRAEVTRHVLQAIETRDDFLTFDAATVDSTGVFLIGELERLDQRLHMPLAAVTWARDIDLREDVSMADEVSSFTNSSFAQAQGVDSVTADLQAGKRRDDQIGCPGRHDHTGNARSGEAQQPT